MDGPYQDPHAVPRSHSWMRAFVTVAVVFAMTGSYMCAIAARSAAGLLGGAVAGVALAAVIVGFSAGVAKVSTGLADRFRR